MMGKRIEGIDVSHWNSIDTIVKERPQFVMMKLTEGYTYTDWQYTAHREQARNMGIPYGYYHYCRAEKNDAIKEADFFVSRIPQEDLPHVVLALDFEGKSLSIKLVDDWALRFLVRVEQLTGKKPLLYCSQSTVKRFPRVAASGFGLWVARYRNKLLGCGDISPFKLCAMWQYTSKGCDKNIFYGTIEQFKKYGEVKQNGK